MNSPDNFNVFLKDKKGQEFDVFKLLISAVVAVVILGLLLSIINIIIPPAQGNPSEEAGKLVQSIVNKPAQLQETQQVTFTNGKNINARGISLATKGYIEESAVCLSLGDFGERAGWTGGIENGNGASISYTASDSLQAKIAAVCDTVSAIQNAPNGDYFTSYIGSSMKNEWFQSCECLQDAEGKCCFVALKRTS